MHARPWLLTSVLAAGLALTALAQEDPSQTLETLRQRWTEAYNAGDLAAVAELYVEDARLLDETGAVHAGRDAILDAFERDQQELAQAVEDAQPQITVQADTWGSDGELAFETGRFTVTLEDGTAVDEGRYLVVSRRVDGELRIVAHMNTSSMTAPDGSMDGG